MPRSDVPALHDRALDNLRYIRETMERAGPFTAISGWGIVAIGAMACAAAVALARIASPARWLACWIGVAVVAASISLATTAAKARRTGTSLITGQSRKLVLAFAPPMAVGVLLTAALAARGMHAMLPAVWMLLYGSAVIAGGAYSIRVIPLMGVAFLVAGAIALLVPDVSRDWLMAASFGALHLAFGARIAVRHGG
jgi:hypothetical protein